MDPFDNLMTYQQDVHNAETNIDNQTYQMMKDAVSEEAHQAILAIRSVIFDEFRAVRAKSRERLNADLANLAKKISETPNISQAQIPH